MVVWATYSARDVYPPGLLTVARDRCSAGGERDDGVGVGKSSGCGCAGSLTLLGFFDGLGKSLGISVAGGSHIADGGYPAVGCPCGEVRTEMGGDLSS